MQTLRSLIFIVWMYGLMGVLGVAFLPMAIWSRDGAYRAVRVYLRLVLAGLERLCGLRCETRGPIPQGDVLVAAKHQSFLDILILFHALPRPKFVMKRELVWAPVLGFYALRIGATAVRRGRGRRSIREMRTGVGRSGALDGQLVIYPQGTRVAPGQPSPYKFGAHVLYESHDLPCVPAAANTGVFWPKRGVRREPGLAVVEFLPAMPKGMAARPFLRELEARIEPASARLEAEGRRAKGG